MTIKEGAICGLVQSFPILLILAQNYGRCLKTPLIYKPPTPTPSPEYYEALEALVQNIFGHGHHGTQHTHGCEYGTPYGYGKKTTHGKYAISPCHTYSYPGHDSSHYGHGTYSTHTYPGVYTKYPSYGGSTYPTVYGGSTYPSTTYHGYSGYPTYGYKKISVYNMSGTDRYKGTYAPTQVYNLNHKYKVVVKKNRKKRPYKLQSLSSALPGPDTKTEEVKEPFQSVIN